MAYQFVAVNEAGKKIRGRLNGTEAEVVRDIRGRGWTLVSIEPDTSNSSRSVGRLTEADLETVFSRLSYLAESGVKVDRAFALLSRGNLPEHLKSFLDDIGYRLNQGETLYQSLQQYSDQIDDIYLASIRLGEEIGSLGTTFGFIASSLQSRIRLRKDIQKATIYPAAIVVFSLLSLFFIFNFIVPRITGIFQGVEEIPWYTAMLMAASEFSIDYQFHLLGLVLGGAILVGWGMNQPAYREAAYQAMFRIPGIRGFLQQSEQIRFCGAMSLALGSGLLMYDALNIASETVKNPVSRNSLRNAAREISEGKGAAEALSNAHFLTEFHASLLEVSQDRDALRAAFADIAARLEEELNGNVSRMLILMEPALIGIMGVVIGGIVLIMMLSILSIQNIGL